MAAMVCLAGVPVLISEIEPHYPIEQWLFWPVALLWVYLALYTAACVGMGHVVLRRLWKDPRPLAETWLLSKCIGLVIFVLGLYVAGFAGWFHPAVAVGLPGVMVLASARDLVSLVRRTITELRQSAPATNGSWVIRTIAAAAAAIGFVILYAIAFSPEALSLDAGWYHLPISQDYARAGRIIPFPSEYQRAFPHLSSMVYTWGFLLPGVERPFNWMMALHIEFVVLMWKAVCVSVAAQWLLGDYKVRSLWTGFFLFPLVFAFAHSVTAGADHFIGLWAVPMFLVTMKLLRDFDLRWALLLGLFSGGAILSKYQAIYMIAACGSLIAARWFYFVARLALKKELPCKARRLWQAPLVVLGVGLAVAAPHFVKNVVYYGDPMYPFLQAKLSSAHPTHDLADYLFHAKLGSEGNRPTAEGMGKLTHAMEMFALFSFRPSYVVVKQPWPLFGSLFILLLPTLFFLKRTGRLWIATWCCFVVITVWSNTYLQDRYINSAAPLFFGVTMAILVRLWRLSWLTRLALVPLVSIQVSWSLDSWVFTGENLIHHSLKLGRSGWEGRVEDEERFPHRRRFDFVNEATPPDAQVLVRGSREVLGLDRFAHRDVQWQQANIHYAPLHNVQELWEHYRDKGITHVVYRKNRHYAGTMQSTVLFSELVARSGMPLKNKGGWVLMELPPQPPPGPSTIKVACIGLNTVYANGLYNVEDLGLYGPKDRKERGSVKPRQKAKTDAEKMDIVKQADVVLIGIRQKLPPGLNSIMVRDFNVHETIRRTRVYLRKPDKARQE